MPNCSDVTVLADAPVVAIVKITSAHIPFPFRGWWLGLSNLLVHDYVVTDATSQAFVYVYERDTKAWPTLPRC